MAKIAVTGGAGFVGSNLTRELIYKGHEVVVVDDLSTGLISNLKDLDVTFHEVSITDPDGLKKALYGAECIFHLAARGSVPRSIVDPKKTIEVNIIGTQNVLECARESKARVIFTSSSSVYGRNNDLPKHEEMWTSPLSPYAASKLAGEALMESYAQSYSLEIVIFRLFNVFGPYQRPDHVYSAVIPKWIWNAITNKPLKIFGNGLQTRDFTYVDTVVDFLIASLERKLKHENPINLAFGNRISLNDIAFMLQDYFPDIELEYETSRIGDILDSQNNPQLILKLLPDVEITGFELGIKKTISWMKDSFEMYKPNSNLK